MTDRQPETLASPWDAYPDADPSQDTVSLLQEEIARLEAELRARDDAPPPAPSAPETVTAPEPPTRINELLAQVAERDEMVDILLEQTRVLEESVRSQRAEWDQLNEWVDRVEARVSEAPRLQGELDVERERFDAFRRSAESDRRDWDARRLGLEREAQLLRDQITRQNEGADDHARQQSVFLELAAENRRLRTDREALRAKAEAAQELNSRLDAALAELVQVRRELREAVDAREHDRVEYEAQALALRDRLDSPPTPAAVTEPSEAEAEPAARPSPLEADERIRAFRQHLRDLHDGEAARRANSSIASRISRLWRHNGPT